MWLKKTIIELDPTGFTIHKKTGFNTLKPVLLFTPFFILNNNLNQLPIFAHHLNSNALILVFVI